MLRALTALPASISGTAATPHGPAPANAVPTDAANTPATTAKDHFLIVCASLRTLSFRPAVTQGRGAEIMPPNYQQDSRSLATLLGAGKNFPAEDTATGYTIREGKWFSCSSPL